MVINLLQEQDVATFQQLRLRALHDHPEAFGMSFEEEQAQTHDQVAVQLRDSPTGSFTLGARLDGNLVGVVQLLRYQRIKTRHKAMLSGMYVVTEARGQGLGAALLRATLERASGLDGLEDISLAVTVGNAAARKLYLRAGFVPYGIEPRYIKVGEQYFDIEWMILHLEGSMTDLTIAFATFPVLETERFILRAATHNDAFDMFRIMRDPGVTRYFGRLPMVTLDEAVQRVHELHTAFEEQDGIRWAITSRANGQLIGTCGFWRLIKEHARAEIGYELAQEWWGQGVMTEVLRAVLSFGFTTMGLHSVEAQIHPANIGSRRVLEKLGFVQEGYFHENYYDVVEAQFTDTAVFSLLNVRAGNDSLQK